MSNRSVISAATSSLRVIALAVIICLPLHAVTVSDSGVTPLYDTFELTLDAPGVSGNKFRSFAAVTFSKGDGVMITP